MPTATAERPSIVLVLTDDQRITTMSRMTALWSLVRRKGVLYPNAMVPTSLCCPSRASLLTGLYAHHTGVYSNDLPDGGWQLFHDRGMEKRTIAVALQAAGYRTGMFGKYLNGNFPAQVRDGYTPPGWDTMVTYTTPPGFYNYSLNDGTSHGSGPGDLSTDVLARHAVEFVRASPKDKPLFLLYTPSSPHRTFTAAPRHRGAWKGRIRSYHPPSVTGSVASKPPWIRKLPRVPQATIDDDIRKQQESLMAVDDAVRDLVDALTDTGRMHNTMFVYLGDNGLMLGEHHLNAWKNLPYRMSTSVPMTIRWDGHLRANGLDRRLALNIDVAATIAGVIGASMKTDGLSLMRTRTRAGFPLEGATWHSFDSLPKHPAYCGWRTTNWMFTQYASGEQELFHYRSDPHEQHNLADDPAHRERLRTMRRKARAACKPVPPTFRWP